MADDGQADLHARGQLDEASQEWLSGRISRREFLRRAALVAGGTVAATSLASSLGCSSSASDAPAAQASTPSSPAQSTAASTAVPSATPKATETVTTTPSTPSRDDAIARLGQVRSTPQPDATPKGGNFVDMNLDLEHNPYSRRRSVIAGRGVVATSQPLAVEAGIEMLRRGGNAVDAALAAAITLTVVEPTSNGIGADAFALVWDGKKLHGLNGSGRAAAALTLDAIHAAGYDAMPTRGWLPVTVPGAPRAWRDLHERFGKLPFADLFEPAIRHAEQGHKVSPIVAQYWGYAAQTYSTLQGPEFRGWKETFAPRGRAPKAGETWASPGHASTLRRIAQTGADDFYKGQVAQTFIRFAKETGGLLHTP